MKRFLVLVVVLILVLNSSSISEGIDFTGYSTDELLNIRRQINEELMTRISDDSSIMYSGRYEVGKDIKSGRYLITFINAFKSHNICGMRLKDSLDSEDSFYKNFEVGEEYAIVLEDGMIIELVSGTATLRPIPEPSWAP